jgi:hypothetical protein
MVTVARRIVILVAAFMALSFLVILAGQTVQLAAFAERIHPVAGAVVFWGLLLAYVALIAVPLLLYLRLPRALIPPPTDHGPEFEAHLAGLRARLARNPATSALPLNTRTDIEGALRALDARAEEVVKAAGSRAFLLTAVSQNGALDSLIVLGIQSRLVLDVARVYSQRPSPREITWLYANVFTTAFIAGQIEDMDVAEIIQPVVSTAAAAVISTVPAALIPGSQPGVNLFLNAVISGSANAFLTLRVGIVAQEQCRALVRPQRRTLRRTAIARATGMLGGIVSTGAKTVWSAGVGKLAKGFTTAVSTTVRGTIDGAVTGTTRRFKDVGGAVAAILARRGKGVAADPTGQGPAEQHPGQLREDPADGDPA